MHAALEAIREAVRGTEYEGKLWLVGGAVRDDLLGLPEQNDLDVVLLGSATAVASFLYKLGVSSIPPVTYERFGTAMVRICSSNVEFVTARRESYAEDSRKPLVQPATLEEDALRRDFTVNTMMRNLSTGELVDPLGTGLVDLKVGVLKTPLDPVATFRDDPLRMLRAVRFRWQLGFRPADGLYEAIRDCAPRLQIISGERIRDELVKMLLRTTAADALKDLMDLGLLAQFAPELVQMVGVEQGRFHHLDVWDHSLLVVRNAGAGDLTLTVAALLHDVGKPSTQMTDENGQIRFFGHESVGAELTKEILRRLKFSNDEISPVVSLVKNHMRLGSSPQFSASAARRLLRDLGDLTPKLLHLVEADTSALKPGVKALDLKAIRDQLSAIFRETPPEKLQSPLSGREIMEITGLSTGKEVGRIKQALVDKVLEGALDPTDRDGARALIEQGL